MSSSHLFCPPGDRKDAKPRTSSTALGLAKNRSCIISAFNATPTCTMFKSQASLSVWFLHLKSTWWSNPSGQNFWSAEFKKGIKTWSPWQLSQEENGKWRSRACCSNLGSIFPGPNTCWRLAKKRGPKLNKGPKRALRNLNGCIHYLGGVIYIRVDG